MKQFETKLTVRIYDTKLVENLNEIFKRNTNRYQTKNQLLVELLERGIADKMRELPTPPNAPASAKIFAFPAGGGDDTSELLKQMKAMVADMHDYNKKHIEGLLAHLKMSERISSSIYNVLLAIATDEPVTKTQVEIGYFDDVPQRFIVFLHELLSELLEDDEDDSDSEDTTGGVVN